MKLARSAFLSAFAVVLSVVNARAYDVTLPHSTHRIEVIPSSNRDFIHFRECDFETSENGNHPCRRIGERDWYSLEDLRAQATVEKWQVAGATAADLGILAVTISGVTAITAAYVVGTGTFVGMGSSTFAVSYVVGAPVWGSLSFSAINLIKAINPKEQYRQARTIRDDVIEDREVRLKNEKKLNEFIARLEVVLEKL
jgi:hypothetical protein